MRHEDNAAALHGPAPLVLDPGVQALAERHAARLGLPLGDWIARAFRAYAKEAGRSRAAINQAAYRDRKRALKAQGQA